MIHKRYRRMIFVPIGLISLVMLSILFLLSLINDQRAQTKVIFEINLFPKDYYSSYYKHMVDFDIPPNGKWDVFRFTINETTNEKVLNELHKRIVMFRTQRDTLCGIEIRMEKRMSYNRFIKIIEILNMEEINYNLNDDSIWIHRYPCLHKLKRHIKEDIFICGGVGISELPAYKVDRSLANTLALYKDYFANNFVRIPLHIIFGLLIIILLNIVRIYKAYHNMYCYFVSSSNTSAPSQWKTSGWRGRWLRR
jgi:hypothetical protein